MRKELFNLLFRGYLPKELPPAFNSYDYALQMDDVRNALSDNYGEYISYPSTFSIPKNGIGRRTLSIINPYSFYRLADCLSSNSVYNMLNEICKDSDVSKSMPKLCDDVNRRAIITSCKSVADFHTVKLCKSLYKRIELKIDISCFYATIYTHAITWMTVGKNVAKDIWRGKLANPGYTSGIKDIDDKYNLANQIDSLVECCQDKQTHGIPIGPDTSFLLAETLLCHIDDNIKKALRAIPDAPEYYGCRYFDDWFLYVDSKDEAETVLRVVIQELEKFGLEVNLSKVEINEMPVAVLDDFADKLSSFDFHNSSNIERVKVFFEVLWSLIRNCRNRAATFTRYAMRVLKSFLSTPVLNSLSPKEKGIILKMLYRTVVDLPDCIPAILPVANVLGIAKDKSLPDLIDAILRRHVGLSHHIEVAWALWICKLYETVISPDHAVRILSEGNSVCCLLLLDYLNNVNSTLLSNPDISGAVTALSGRLNASSLHNQDWLLLYEGVLKGWLKGVDHLVDGNPFFCELKKRSVSFYDIDPNADYQSPTYLLHSSKQLPLHLKTEIEKNSQQIIGEVSKEADRKLREVGDENPDDLKLFHSKVDATRQDVMNEVMLSILTDKAIDSKALSRKYSSIIRSIRVS